MEGEFGTATGEMAELLALQRADFARSGTPDAAARIEALTRLERIVVRERAEIGRVISEDFGHRALTETDLLEIVPALNAIRHARRHVARWMQPRRRRVAATFQPSRASVRHQPLGVVGIVAPWNYPLLLCIAPMVDAIAAGNRVMIKPSEATPSFSAWLARALGGAFDRTHVAVVQGGPDAAAAFCGLRFDHLLFTGSTATGRKVALAAAANLVPVTLELGGKSPAIVCPDADLARAARSIAFGKFVNAGQTCIAPDYVLVDEARGDALTDALAHQIRRLYPRLAGNNDYTAIISEQHRSRLQHAIEQAEAAGARVIRVHVDEAPGRIGPVLVQDAPADCMLMTDEIFGPVLPVATYRDLDDAVARVAAGERPLALYCFTRDERSRETVLSRTISGGVTVNGTLMHIAQDDLPFGGVGASGIGAYHGHDGFKRLSHARAVHEIGFFNGFELFAPPFGRLARQGVRALIGRAR